MIIKWSDFLQAHPFNADYDTNAHAIQSLISINETPDNSFRHLVDNKTLVCISKNSLDGDIQATFNQTIKRTSFLQTNPDYYAMMGFGTRASAVKIHHVDLFKHTQRTKSVPDFKALLQCKTTEEIINLPVNSDKISIDFYALLPPCLAEEIFDAEDLSPGAILLRFIHKINKLQTSNTTTGTQSDIDTTEDDNAIASGAEDPTNAMTNTTTASSSTSATTTIAQPSADSENTNQDHPNPSDSNVNEPHPAEPNFSRIINFLYECIKEPRVIQSVAINTCTKQSTIEWLDHQHSAILDPSDRPTATTAIPQANNAHTETLIASIGSLTAAMAERQLRDLDSKQQSKTTDGIKKFDNLAPITKNTTILCTMVPDMHQDELHEIEPSAAWTSLIGLKSSTTIVRTIEHAMRNRGCLVYLQKGMCNDFRHGTIASSPDPFERNGLCVFLMAPEETKRFKVDRLRELEEKAARNKLDKDDIELLTSNDVYFPKDFWAFEHMLRNFYTITAYLFGPDCLMARAWKIVLDHANSHQATYKRFEREYQHFYVSVLDELHRRTQTFIHSAADGLISSLKTKQLDFSIILDSIENHTYFVRRPHGLPKHKPDPPQHPQQPNKKHRTPNARGELVYNNNVHKDMQVPKPGTYHDVFAPEFTRGLKIRNHRDGTEKCNNFHHRGRCYSNCHRIASHSKTLTATEISEGRDSMLKAFGRWTAKQGKSNPTVPPGLPPTAATDGGCDNSSGE